MFSPLVYFSYSHIQAYELFKLRYAGLQKRQSTGGFLDDLAKLSNYLPKLPAMLASGSTSGPGTPPVSRVAEMQSENAIIWPGAKRVKVRYGPYRIPPVSENNLESEFWKIQGMSNAVRFNAKRPCEGECTLLSVTADLEYADGSAANNSNGVCGVLQPQPLVYSANMFPGLVPPRCPS